MTMNINAVMGTGTIEIELARNSKVFPKHTYRNGVRTDEQETDNKGNRLFTIRDVGLFSVDGTGESIMTNIVVHSKTQPTLPAGNHPTIELVDPFFRVWNSQIGLGCTLHCYGIKDASAKVGEK